MRQIEACGIESHPVASWRRHAPMTFDWFRHNDVFLPEHLYKAFVWAISPELKRIRCPISGRSLVNLSGLGNIVSKYMALANVSLA
uniref:Transposase n=1 Tax=Romanomermis culicivorax TaxID=13658 RepID=A0A915KHD6_ROMCU